MPALHPLLVEKVARDEAVAAANAGKPEPTLAEIRAGYRAVAEALGGEPAAVAEVRDLEIPRGGDATVRARLYRPFDAPGGRSMLVWFHGGGWMLGDLDGIDRVARGLANASACAVISVDYRLAPEHPFPAAIEDADAVVAWVAGPGTAALGGEPGRLAVGGDSSGGQIAAVAALHARSLIRAQALVYPALDPRRSGASYREFATGPLLTEAAMQAFWTRYLDGHSNDDPDVNPALGALEGAPRAWIAVAHHDPVRDDGRAYGAALRAAGVSVAELEFRGMTHGFLRWGGLVSEARDLIEWLGAGLRCAFA